MMLFHKILLVLILIVAFFQGAIDAGRRDLLNQFLAERLVNTSFYELGEINVHRKLFRI